jgi:5-methylcytosine-specific restriction enzyme subunit McrC
MPRRYVGHEDDLRALRGRLDVIRQFTILAASPQKLACRFDELSHDIALNQIMKAAVRRLMSISRSAENQRRITELLLAFDGVRDVPVRALAWDQVVLDRTNIAWAQLLNLAKLLLGNRFQSTSAGEAEGFSLLFEMNKLFEEFVGRVLKRALVGTQYHVNLQGPLDYALADIETGRRKFATKPDIVISDANGPALIIDTKWKRLKGAIDDPKQGVGQSDVYQMMAYSQVYRCPRVMLLYPHHSPLGEAAGQLSVHEIVGATGNHICVATLSLKDPKRVAHELRQLLSGEFAGLNLPLALAA